MAITIIFAPPRTGKTSLMTHLLNIQAYDRNRIRAMQNEIMYKNATGFNLSIPIHCVASNYDITFKKFRCTPRVSRRINPFRLGFANQFVETHFNLPYEIIGITEGQKYFNSRMSTYYPDWQSRFMEQHGHDDLDILIDTQRPMLIDVNIRELSSFIEIIKLNKSYNKRGKICKLEWTVRKIENSSLFDKYMSSGKQDITCYTEETIIAEYDVFKLYDSKSCKPKFYDGHIGKNFDLYYSEPTEESLQGYIRFLEKNDDELPPNFYKKRTT